MREIDLTEDLLPRHAAALRALQIVSTKVSVDNWCLVGGLMVLTAAREVGRPLARAEVTKNADVVVDVCAESKILRDFAYQLNGIGYDIPAEAWEHEGVARCTFVSGYTAIDVLCPNDAAPESLSPGDRIESIAIPGGRRALELAELARIHYADDASDVEIRVPMLLGAIIVKGHAMIDPVTENQPRHGHDVVGLLSIVDDPEATRVYIAEEDRAVLREVRTRLRDETSRMWVGFSDEIRLLAQATIELLTK